MTKNKSRPLLLSIACMMWTGVITAQESVPASGGNGVGSGGSVAYSVGQLVYTTYTASSGNVAQGVQHAYEILTLGIPETVTGIGLKAFPNPTTDYLVLQIDGTPDEKWSYRLTDLEGRLLNAAQITESDTQIEVSHLPAASYFIHILDVRNTLVQSFQLIKN